MNLRAKPGAHIEEVEALGGMAKAIEAGIPKLRIEEAAAKTQARIDTGTQSVIGVNKYRADRRERRSTCSRSTIRPCGAYRSTSSSASRRSAIRSARRKRLTRLPAPPIAVTAICWRLRSTRPAPRQPSARFHRRSKRYSAAIAPRSKRSPGSTSGRSGMTGRRRARARRRRAFETAEGRRPRILVAKIGQDGHDRGQKVIASAFADLGFDVDIGPLFATPAEAARQAVENDVHILGVSSLAAAHLTLVPELKAELEKQGRDDIMIVVGGVVPPQDYDALMKAGAEAIFPPGTVIAEAAEKLLKTLNRRLGHGKEAAE